MQLYLFYLFLGISPAVFWLWYFYRKDKWEPEPRSLVIKIFFLGVLAIVPAVIVEWAVQNFIFDIHQFDPRFTGILMNFTMCFLIIAPIEEFFKYAVVKRVVYRSQEFDEEVDGVIYMVAAAMGFAALENVIYILGLRADTVQAVSTGIVRGLLATPAHAVFSGFVGLYLGKAKFAKQKSTEVFLICQGLLIGIVLHGIYDFVLFSAATSGLARYLAFVAIPFLVVLFWILVKLVKRAVAVSPFRPGANAGKLAT